MDLPRTVDERRAIELKDLPRTSDFFYDLFSNDTEPTGPQREWTSAQVAEHNRPGDLFLTLKAKVYDVSPFVRSHPGRHKLLLGYAGSAADALYEIVHGESDEVNAVMLACQVGCIKRSLHTRVESTIASLQRLPNDLYNEIHFYDAPWQTHVEANAAPGLANALPSFSRFAERWQAMEDSVSGGIHSVCLQAWAQNMRMHGELLVNEKTVPQALQRPSPTCTGRPKTWQPKSASLWNDACNVLA